MGIVFSLTVAGCVAGGDTTTITTPVGPNTTMASSTDTTVPPAGQIVKKMAVVAPEVAKDFGWNQQGVESAKKVAAEIGAQIEIADGAGYEDITPLLRELAQGGSNLTIAFASGYGTSAVQLAQELKVPHIVIGQFEKGNVPGLAQDIETNAQNGAYLAGIVAAKTTKTGTVGIVMSADDENWVKMAGGFVQGARSVNADLKILMAQVGQAGYADAAGGKRVTESVIAGGADVIFGMGDGSSFGMIQAVETATPPKGADKVWFIDVIGDKTSLDKKGVVLTSVVWDYSGAFAWAIDQLNAGTFGSEVYYLDVDNGGMHVLKTPFLTTEVMAAVEEAQRGIIDGSIKVTETTTKADVEIMIK
jgi:simple sugar transport system substrate-binding protein